MAALELAEKQREAELLFVRQRLITEHQNGIFGHAGMDGRNLVWRLRPPAVDTRDFAGEGGGQPPDRYAQTALLRDADRKNWQRQRRDDINRSRQRQRGYRVGVGTGRHVDARQPRETDVNRLDGKVVLISGQRAASARLMVEAGAKVAVGDAIPYAYLDLRRCE
jgi:hypothetical protein